MLEPKTAAAFVPFVGNTRTLSLRHLKRHLSGDPEGAIGHEEGVETGANTGS